MAIAENMLLRRGTTPTLAIITDIYIANFEYCEVTFASRQPPGNYAPESKIILTKATPNIVCSGKSIIVTLTQEDTLQLGEN
ncbi:MAG: hypothetical protein RR389_01110, partial [Christensenella sp.]